MLNGKEKEQFAQESQSYLEALEQYFPFLSFNIQSSYYLKFFLKIN